MNYISNDFAVPNPMYKHLLTKAVQGLSLSKYFSETLELKMMLEGAYELASNYRFPSIAFEVGTALGTAERVRKKVHQSIPIVLNDGLRNVLESYANKVFNDGFDKAAQMLLGVQKS